MHAIVRSIPLLLLAASAAFAQSPRPAGPLELMPVNGPPVSLSELRGRPVAVLLVDIAECPACEDAVRIVSALDIELGPAGLEILGAAIDQNDEPGFATALDAWVAGLNPSFPIGRLDQDGLLSFYNRFGRIFVPRPMLFVIDTEGRIVEEYAYDVGRVAEPFWANPEANLRAALYRALGAEAPPELSEGGIVDAASFTPAAAAGGRPAAGSIVSIFGAHFSDQLAIAQSTPLPTSLNGVSVLLDGEPLPLFFVAQGQINAQLPYVSGEAMATIVNAAGESISRTLTVNPHSPSIFSFNQSGGGQGVIVFADTATLAAPRGLTGDSRPARAGETLTIFANGLGEVTPPIEPGVNSCDPDGVCEPDFSNLTLRHAVVRPIVEIGGRMIPDENLIYAGLAPQFVGLFQLNLTLPEGTPTGNAVPIVLRQGTAASRGDVTLAVEGEAEPSDPLDADEAEGKLLFEVKCSVCHYVDRTDRKIGPGLAGIGNGTLPSGLPATPDNIRRNLNVGGNGMPAYENLLSEEEKDDIVAYLLTL